MKAGESALESETPVSVSLRAETELPAVLKLIRWHGRCRWDESLPAPTRALHAMQERRWNELLVELVVEAPKRPKGRRGPIFLGPCDGTGLGSL